MPPYGDSCGWGKRIQVQVKSLGKMFFVLFCFGGFFCHVTSVNILLLSKSWSYYVSIEGLSVV